MLAEPLDPSACTLVVQQGARSTRYVARTAESQSVVTMSIFVRAQHMRPEDGVPKPQHTAPAKPTWTCPHCGHVHTAAMLLRLDSETLQCQFCKHFFSSIPDPKDKG